MFPIPLSRLLFLLCDPQDLMKAASVGPSVDLGAGARLTHTSGYSLKTDFLSTSNHQAICSLGEAESLELLPHL